MNPSLILFASVFIIAILLPRLVRSRRLQSLLGKVPPRKFRQTPVDGTVEIQRTRSIQAMLVISVALLGVFLPRFTPLDQGIAAVSGLVMGVFIWRWLRVEGERRRQRGATALLKAQGIHSIFGTEIDAADILGRIDNSCTINILTLDGIDILEALSHPAHPPLNSPSPGIENVKIRLLVLPPRSQRIGPRCQARSCAEETLTRMGIATDVHWLRLQQTIETVSRWQDSGGPQLEIRFLEEVPVMEVVQTPGRTWFRPWFSVDDGWLVTDGGPWQEAICDRFECAWQDSSAELSFRLTPTHRPAGGITSGNNGSVAISRLKMESARHQ